MAEDFARSSVVLTRETMDRLRVLAKAHDRSVMAEMRHAIRIYVAQHERASKLSDHKNAETNLR